MLSQQSCNIDVIGPLRCWLRELVMFLCNLTVRRATLDYWRRRSSKTEGAQRSRNVNQCQNLKAGLGKGASIKYVCKNFGILDTPPLFVRISRNYSSAKYGNFQTFPPPLSVDILNGSSLRVLAEVIGRYSSPSHLGQRHLLAIKTLILVACRWCR